MTDISHRWLQIQQQAADAARESGRDPAAVTVMAVSKTFPLASVETAYAAGARHFGENYVQEGIEKAQAFHPDNLRWHFIGPLQSNKTRPVAEHFDWVHTIDRVKIARRLSEQRPDNLAPLQVCIQVNISADPDKAGVAADECAALAQAIAGLPRLQLRGLMTIPAVDLSRDILITQFQDMQQLQSDLQQRWPELDTLSMGMSDDMVDAIACGSTFVRIGRSIFGTRPRKPATD